MSDQRRAEDDGTEDETTYGLVMPFVVCKSAGGPYDDEAFVAGVRFAQHAAEINAAPHLMAWSDYVLNAAVPQYDLLAMDNGFVMTAVPWADFPDEWTLVTFTRATDEVPDGD